MKLLLQKEKKKVLRMYCEWICDARRLKRPDECSKSTVGKKLR